MHLVFERDKRLKTFHALKLAQAIEIHIFLVGLSYSYSLSCPEIALIGAIEPFICLTIFKWLI